MIRIIYVCLVVLILAGCSISLRDNKKEIENVGKNIIEKSNMDVEKLKNNKAEKNEIEKISIEDDNELIQGINEPADEDLVRILDYIPNILIDLKYATTDNFTGVVIYDSNEAYLRYGTVKKLMQVQEILIEKGYSLVVWDAYRPIEAQFKLWEVCPNGTYVANPNTGYSSHSRGNTVDVSIVKLEGSQVEMPSKFDDFSKLANRDYSDVPEMAKENAMMLEEVMKECDFNPYFNEWWHYSDLINYDVVK